MNTSWNEAAVFCANIGALLPFHKKYAYETFPHREEAHGYASAMMMEIFLGQQRFGDITFVGFHRKVWVYMYFLP